MRAMVIGASGYLGARVHRAALAAGMEVVTAGRRPVAGRHVAMDLVADGPFVVGETIAAVAPDVVLNCAGVTAGDLPTLSAGNIDATANLVTALVRTGSPARLVHLGSAAEYGRCAGAVPVREDAPARPLGAYGVTKLAGTRIVEICRSVGLSAVVLRVFNPVGPGAPAHTLPGRAASEIARAVRERDVVRLGGLDAVRDFVDADDVAGAVLAAAVGPVPAQGVVNVGSGRPVSARELVTALVDVAGAGVAVEEGDAGSARSAQVPWQQADITLATAAWGWRPDTPLAASLAGLWECAR